MVQVALTVTNIVFVNALLSADNALVLAMLIRPLEEHRRRVAMFWGTMVLVLLLVALSGVAGWMMGIPGVKSVGALFLCWIALKLLVHNEEVRYKQQQRQTYSIVKIVWLIVAADLVMSIDNVVAIAAIANGQIITIGIGLAVSIPVILWGSHKIAQVLDQFPILLWVGTAILAWTAGRSMSLDPWLSPWLSTNYQTWQFPTALTLIILAFAWLWIRVKKRLAVDKGLKPDPTTDHKPHHEQLADKGC